MAKTLLIVGGGAEQVPAYERAKQRGLVVVGTDMSPDAPALKLADHALIASTRNAEQTAEAALDYARERPIDGVITIANDVPYTVALVAERLGLPGIGIEAARNVSDKLLMKEHFTAHGVLCPAFAPIANLAELERHVQAGASRRFVLKPVDGRGARGVLLIDDTTNLAWAVEESARWGDCGRLIVEEFIAGMQLSTESFLHHGQCFTAAIAERNYSRLDQFRPNIIEDGGTIPAPVDAKMRQRIDDLILRGAHALGITEGIVKGDIVIDGEGRPMIIELAARLSGGWFATHQIPAASGIDLVSAVISQALGEPIDPEALIPSRDAATAIRYWYPAPGRILSICGEAALKQVPGLIKYGFFRGVGDIQPPIRMHADRFGFVIVTADRRDQALARVAEALECIQVEVAP